MALVFSSSSSLFVSSAKAIASKPVSFFSSKPKTLSSVSFIKPNKTHPLTLRCQSSSQPDPVPEPDSEPVETPVTITDEWAEKTGPEPDQEVTKVADTDPPKDEDELEEQLADTGNGRDGTVVLEKEKEEEDDNVGVLKRCLVDTVNGTEFGFRAGADVRAEVLELVNQLEALNPTPNPVNAAGILDGNWVLV